ncbi:hypothetical protein KDL01_31840 [Actinospica durhamensis]|uniref:Uncharacterized protein n=1 Tax=Actinospica durhamensis TaxID=1508375 RepID=A0A941EZ96_9ACTN|nr:DUF5682 family protein [Actinospica durhamensis]MBR7837909.1 hypothetical protein [Actinospica durhamensis]
MTAVESGPFAALRGQLVDAAAQFGGADALAGILGGMVEDVDRALREELEIFPVCHHSPASALAMVRRLREKRPAVIYLELCEDFTPLLEELRNCRLPVALQAFACETDGFPLEWSPLSVVAPLTQASAEYQAIAYALDTEGVELVLVDRSTDHVFQWSPQEQQQTEVGDPESVQEEAGLHGDAVGVEMGDLRPRFRELEEHLLHHGRVRHWSEWWDQYVEQPLSTADYATYRQVMVMIGSLFRHLRRDHAESVDEERERYMWTRMREHLAATGTDPARCLYVCGAFHAASRVEQFGLTSQAPYEISPRTKTTWQYGMIPSSHSSIETQFGLAPGSVSIAAATWAKALKRGGEKPFTLRGSEDETKGKAGAKAAKPRKTTPTPRAVPAVDQAAAPVAVDRLSTYIGTPPRPDTLDEEELLGWCVDIVALARRNGYLASTADAIAVYDTSILLAGMRGRKRPTPYDFQDAAITCIEKDVVPGRRNVRRLCEILLGGDRIGRVGYASLPPLARDVLDRLSPLGLDLERRTLQRALLDLGTRPELRPCSDVLWILQRLLPADAARPIMGSRELGERPIQESWDLAIGKHQRALVELGYEGISVEQVLEQRLRAAVYAPDADPAIALRAVEEALLFLGGRRLADDLGARAVELLAQERTADRAPEVLRRIRKLLTHFRTEGQRLPGWCEDFATKGYAHYCTLLPAAFADEHADVRQVGAVLGFLFSMEGLALSLGCDHAQLEIAIRQSHPEAPGKVALLWAARFQLGELTLPELSRKVAELVENPLVVPALPQYLSGLIQALDLAPALAPLVVETLSRAFGTLPDSVLLPWLPRLIATLKDQAGEYAPVLVREAGRTFPGTLAQLEHWVAPWDPGAQEAAAGEPSLASAAVGADIGTGPAAELLRRHPAAAEAIAVLLAT